MDHQALFLSAISKCPQNKAVVMTSEGRVFEVIVKEITPIQPMGSQFTYKVV